MADHSGNWSRDEIGQRWSTWWVDDGGYWNSSNDRSGRWCENRRHNFGTGSGWTQSKRRRTGVAVSNASSSGVVVSAASGSREPHDVQWWSENIPDGLRYFDNQNMQDMKQEQQKEAKTPSRRVEKLGKAFQNYRRVILKILRHVPILQHESCSVDILSQAVQA